MLDTIKIAVDKGAKIFASISGGKDGQAMTKVLASQFKITGLVHAELGRIEWAESLENCKASAQEFGLPLHIITRADGRDMVDHWKNRMYKLAGQGKPFWSSSAARYCTSDLKRDPINRFFNNCGYDFIISCEGIRAGESAARAKKSPLEIRTKLTSSYYDGMSVQEAISAYKPGKKLVLTWLVASFVFWLVWEILRQGPHTMSVEYYRSLLQWRRRVGLHFVKIFHLSNF
jgi:3'-phosphoadenosine 5'-phosphosulfate sulfotransferase (PAPS reductase)/FAD synthetase